MCKYLGKCDYCTKNNDCPYGKMGSGDAICDKFECNVEDCKRSTCITVEEESEV